MNAKMKLMKKLHSMFKIKESHNYTYVFHKWKFNLLFLDKLLSLSVLILMFIFKPDYFLLFVYILIYPYLFISQRVEAIKYIILSSIISYVWILIANDLYGYNQSMLKIFGYNIFPFLGWSMGLFIVYLIYSHWEYKLNTIIFYKKLLFFTIIYWILLIFIETFAYHGLNIQNMTTSMYSGLPFCDCIHAPNWMKVVYFLIGPLYFTICYILNFKNPHIKEQSSNKN